MKKPMKPCKHPGCRTLTEKAYCPEHRPKTIRVESADWHSLYTDPAYRWQRRRSEQLALEPYCRECSKHGMRTLATDVDHVVPHRGDVELFRSGELQSLCHACHSRKTMREIRERQAEKK